MAATIFIALIYFLLFNVLRSHTNQSFIQEIKEYHYLSGIGGKGIISHQRDSLLEYLTSLNLSLHTKWLTISLFPSLTLQPTGTDVSLLLQQQINLS